MNTHRECIICGSDNAHEEDFVLPHLLDGMEWVPVCGYCKEAGSHEEEDRSRWVGW